MNVLSLFDGMSCGQIALERAGIKVDNYFASEIDKNAIKITQINYPKTIQLGNVRAIKGNNLPRIDLLIGGSPCRNLSRIATQGGSINWINFEEGLKGDSSLFFHYLRLWNEINPQHFLFENVEMKKDTEHIITDTFGVEPAFICSGEFSAQNRKRLYWTDLSISPSENINTDVLRDIVLDDVDEKYYYNLPIKICESDSLHGRLEFKFKAHDIAKRIYKLSSKSPTLTSCRGGNLQKKIFQNGRCRKLTPLEYERLQTVPDNYTEGVSDSARYNMLGDGWTVDVIAHIFKGLK